ncbi:MAG TPA: LPS export ABC transporter periplasmic protein LptC [Burkholderiales bacterium]
MSLRLSSWYPILLLLLLAMLTAWLERTVQLAALEGPRRSLEEPDAVVENLTAVKSGPDGAPRQVLSASRMVHYPNDDSTHLTEPRFRRIDPAGPPITMRAERGVVSSNGEDVHLMGKVRVVREGPGPRGAMTLDTETLHVIPDKDLAQTDAPVRVTDANTTLTAVGLELDAQNRVLLLKSQVKGNYVPARK